MKYVRDHTGRFDKRPHFEVDYIENLCEQTLFDFVVTCQERTEWPVSTDTFTKLIERDTTELDLYTRMADYGLDDGVEGFTEYSDSAKPSIYINEILSNHNYHEHRLRTTLAHEYGHVLLHGPLFRDDSPCRLLKLPAEWSRPVPRTLSQQANSTDWMEWQANYAMGALLMPRTALAELADWYERKYGFRPPFPMNIGHAHDLIKFTGQKFLVSSEAATIRLKQMCLILNP